MTKLFLVRIFSLTKIRKSFRIRGGIVISYMTFKGHKSYKFSSTWCHTVVNHKISCWFGLKIVKFWIQRSKAFILSKFIKGTLEPIVQSFHYRLFRVPLRMNPMPTQHRFRNSSAFRDFYKYETLALSSFEPARVTVVTILALYSFKTWYTYAFKSNILFF